jgi:hypothetical protein
MASPVKPFDFRSELNNPTNKPASALILTARATNDPVSGLSILIFPETAQ